MLDGAVLVLLALLTYRPGQFDEFRHLKSDLFLDDFQQRNIGGPHIAGFGNKRAAQSSRP